MPIKGDGKAVGIKYWYVISSDYVTKEIDGKKIVFCDSSIGTTDISTNVIKNLIAYGQKNKNISYNISDSQFIYDGTLITEPKKIS